MCFTGAWILQGQLAGRSDPYQQARLFEDVLVHVRDFHVDSLAALGMRSLVLDLRSNPGGVRDDAVQSADLFLDPGQEILESSGRAAGG